MRVGSHPPQVNKQERYLHDTVESILAYTFQDKRLLDAALTHASCADSRLLSNERMEFLGDSILGQIVCEHLYHNCPDMAEGEMTQIKSKVVSRATCATVIDELGLIGYMQMGKGVRNPQASQQVPASVSAALYEAFVAAIYLDGGLDAAERFIKKCWIFDSLTKEVEDPNANPKTRLSDWCGANRTAYAVYETLGTSGPDHDPVFTVKASVEGRGEATAKGGSKAEAERAAAGALLDLLDKT